MPTKKDEARFWSKVDRSGGSSACWTWVAGRTGRGYGQLRWRGLVSYAHRVSYELATGSVVPGGLFVCHSCDNPLCVNPAHLWLGDTSANTADMVAKGRGARGVRSGTAKLSDAEVREMRGAYATGGESYRSLAERYGLNEMTVGRIIRRDSYRFDGTDNQQETQP